MKVGKYLLAISAIFTISISAAVLAAEKHPFGIDDMLRLYRISEPKASPDGKWVVFTASKPDLKANKMVKDIWLASTDGKAVRRITNDANPDWGAVWFPDGRRIAYLSVQNDTSQAWIVEPFTGKRLRATNLPVDVENLSISPDGKWFSFTTDIFPDCSTFECSIKKDKAIADDPVKAKVYEELMFRHWDTWEDGKRGHLFIVPVAGGNPTDLTPGLKSDIPTRPFGGTEEISFSPETSEIAFVTKAEPNEAVHTNSDIFIVDLKTKEKRCITSENKGVDTMPLYSPDGKYIAYLSMARPGYESDKQRIMIYDRKSKEVRDISKDWDYQPSQIAWSTDSKTIFAIASDEGEDPIFTIDVASGTAERLKDSIQYNEGLNVTKEGLVFARDSFVYPAELFTSKLDGSDVKKITSLNEDVMKSVEVSAPEKFWINGAGGDKVQGWFMKPVGFAEGKSYPLAYFIHGGPQWPWNDHLHYRWNMEIAAGRGYAAATVNFHGSPGFGQKFTDDIQKDWGGKPYKDIMISLDYVLKNNKWIDPKKVCALGASYGGYMINWIEGQTDRFACLVNHDGEFSNETSYYATEELWFPEWDFGGGSGNTPYENKANFTKWSPAEHVKDWKTPMLVVQGGRDFRVVETEGMSTFTALKRRGIPARFLYFPDENHWVLKPLNSKRWHEEVYSWLDRWTK
jgi:dipeptidyl aminopeptidase/acylaminoacyl peptidase